MELHIINSNSSGNAYLLKNGYETLIIEAGVQFEKIKQACAFNMRSVVGCIMTHEHGDHSKGAAKMMAAGINVYATKGTFEALRMGEHHRAKVIKSGKEFKLGNFKILPLDIEHDVAEPVCFLIFHPDCGTVLFLTDSKYCRHTFDNLNQVIIEANYCAEILNKQVRDGFIIDKLRRRVIDSHMNIQTCINMLNANDLTKVQNIVLIHLSDKNSDAWDFKRRVERATGRTVHVADAGLTIPLTAKPF